MSELTVVGSTWAKYLPQDRLDETQVERLLLSNYYTFVELTDGSVGAALSYYSMDSSSLRLLEAIAGAELDRDPHLRTFIERDGYLTAALEVATLSALSAPLITNPQAGCRYAVTPGIRTLPLDDVESALVVGFGGLLELLAWRPRIRRLGVADFRFMDDQEAVRDFVKQLVERRPDVSVLIHDGSGLEEVVEQFDLISITGSALTNRTMDGILGVVGREQYVIVQGQTASVVPEAFFDQGVDAVVTSVKTRMHYQLACADRSGAQVKAALDGDLRAPWITMTPKLPA